MGNGSELYQRIGKELKAGEIIFHDGDQGEEMYVIQDGKVRITKKVRDAEKTLIVLGPGEFFGEMALLNKKPRTANAIVEEDAKLLVVDGKTLDLMVRHNAEIAVRMIKLLAQRLDASTAQIENMMMKDLTSRVVHHLTHTAENKGISTPQGIKINITIDDLASRIGSAVTDIEGIMDKMVRAKLIQYVPDGLIVGNVNMLRKYLEYLEMKEKFGE